MSRFKHPAAKVTGFKLGSNKIYIVNIETLGMLGPAEPACPSTVA
jgi:hypothetical protein